MGSGATTELPSAKTVSWNAELDTDHSHSHLQHPLQDLQHALEHLQAAGNRRVEPALEELNVTDVELRKSADQVTESGMGHAAQPCAQTMRSAFAAMSPYASWARHLIP